MRTPAGRSGSLQANPRLSRWIAFGPGGVVRVSAGKVEIGQGILTALAQVVADELHVSVDRVHVGAACTGTHPDEGVTSGSLSVADSGRALRQVGAEVRSLLLAEAARRWTLPVGQLVLDEGRVRSADGRWATYGELAEGGLLERDAAGTDSLGPAARRWVGASVPRADLPDKVFGRPRFIHDLAPPGLLHGRVLRPPHPGCRVLAADLDRVRALPGVLAAVQDGLQFGVVAERSVQADRALRELLAVVRFDAPARLPSQQDLPGWLLAAPAEQAVVAEHSAPAAEASRTLRARYSRPFVAHASLAPSCALACWSDGRVQVWSHTQGIYNLRRDLALSFGCADEQVVVQHVEGAGCYGHNGADDVAWDAAWLARQLPGRTVRVLWTRQGEFTEEPLGPAGLVELEAGLDREGRIVEWRQQHWSPGHSNRPGRAATPTLYGSWFTAQAAPVLPAINVPLANGGGAQRNAVPGYDVPRLRVTSHRVLDAPLRSSALRSLGALLNVFATESFMDELAQAAGVDPVAFRLRHLTDERGRRVIERAVARAGWEPGRSLGEGRGIGIGYARYKGTGAWCAVVAEVEVGAAVRVRRLVVAADLGLVVNPDGAANQLEGGAIQATSVALKEEVRFTPQGITSTDWESYPILRFSEVPAVHVDLVGSAEPSVGAGEASFGPTVAAIANAVHAALGVRVRDLPLTPERLLAELQAAPG
ncbi:MAG TPA: molybdopterin cofactor-binding domain-containing protein [Ramlibacter sp.]|nr:molybdopterin cofactor-binding domain-containing protein [Ramlibacter sp.]